MEIELTPADRRRQMLRRVASYAGHPEAIAARRRALETERALLEKLPSGLRGLFHFRPPRELAEERRALEQLADRLGAAA